MRQGEKEPPNVSALGRVSRDWAGVTCPTPHLWDEEEHINEIPIKSVCLCVCGLLHSGASNDLAVLHENVFCFPLLSSSAKFRHGVLVCVPFC